MLIEKLFLLHRLLFIPYFNNPLGGGEGREGGYSQWWPLRPILPQKGCNEKVGILLPEEYESLRLQGILSFRSVLWPKSATKGFKSRANFSVLWYVYSWGKCIYSSLKREGQSSKLSMWNGYHLSMKGIPGWVEGVASRKKALLSIYLPGFTMRAEVSFRYCQSRSWFVYAPEQTTRLTGKAYDFVMLNTVPEKNLCSQGFQAYLSSNWLEMISRFR